MNIYYDPAKFGLETVGEIDWSDGCYQFDLTVVWRRTFDGRFVYAEDSGCSCPSPFEDEGVEDLTLIKSLAEFKSHLEQTEADRSWRGEEGYRSQEIAELLERMHKAGAR